FSGANACKKVKARRAEVPSTRSAQARNTAQAKRRAVRNGKILSRPDCWPSKPAKRCVDKQSGNLARKPQVCQRSEAGPRLRPACFLRVICAANISIKRDGEFYGAAGGSSR